MRRDQSPAPQQIASPGRSSVSSRLLVTAILVGLGGMLTSCTSQIALRASGSEPLVPASHFSEVASSEPMPCGVPEFFDDGPSIKAEMLDLVESAEDYLLVTSFLLTADEDTEPILEALKRKHEAGVRVHVLADSCALYKPGGKEAFRFLEEAGIPLAEVNPIRLYKLIVAPVMLPRDHRKFWVVDGRTVFLGGANVYANSLKAPEKNGNLDLMVTVDCPEAAEALVGSFVASWNEASKVPLDPADFAIAEGTGGSTHLWLADQNRFAGSEGEVQALFDGLFSVAREEVWLIQPYTFVTPDLVEIVRELKERDVEVNVMLSREVEGPRFHKASHYGILDLLEANGRVWVYDCPDAPLHTKAVLVDGRWASLGSANLNLRSFKISDEVNATFGDPESVGKVTAILEELKAESREVTLEEAETYRGLDYRLTWFLMHWLG